jgi:hypothetical protein
VLQSKAKNQYYSRFRAKPDNGTKTTWQIVRKSKLKYKRILY